MREHAMLFKTVMVLALLRQVDPKTQTRRLITAHNSLVDGAGTSQKRWAAMGFDFSRAWVDPGPSPAGNPGPYLQVPAIRGGEETWHRIYPRVQPGDRLWGREAWAYNPDLPGVAARACFMADPEHRHDGLKWRPSIHMPRAVCRLVLPVSRVGVERLQDINEADAVAEGIARIPPPPPPHPWSGPNRFSLQGMGTGILAGCESWNAPTAVDLYQQLWEHINGANSWAANPWVWVTEFERAVP